VPDEVFMFRFNYNTHYFYLAVYDQNQNSYLIFDSCDEPNIVANFDVEQVHRLIRSNDWVVIGRELNA